MQFYENQTFFIVLAILAGFNRVNAQGTAFSYQGRVTDNGTNFNGLGQFKFALVTSTNVSQQATATATITSGFVTSINVVNAGNGYVNPPVVTISGGGGSGATEIIPSPERLASRTRRCSR
ncbi:MAG TPA: hypothetical protein VMF08_04485 [Candidatus Sulfotelmatobacter sp.]|nr:hypothetical protein [Candidatus Sulfotelmatobacter sp.]